MRLLITGYIVETTARFTEFQKMLSKNDKIYLSSRAFQWLRGAKACKGMIQRLRALPSSMIYENLHPRGAYSSERHLSVLGNRIVWMDLLQSHFVWKDRFLDHFSPPTFKESIRASISLQLNWSLGTYWYSFEWISSHLKPFTTKAIPSFLFTSDIRFVLNKIDS